MKVLFIWMYCRVSIWRYFLYGGNAYTEVLSIWMYYLYGGTVYMEVLFICLYGGAVYMEVLSIHRGTVSMDSTSIYNPIEHVTKI